MKTFSIVSLISMALTLTVAVLGLIGIAFTGFYPGIIVLCLMVMVPIASKWYAKKEWQSPMISKEIISLHSPLLIC